MNAVSVHRASGDCAPRACAHRYPPPDDGTCERDREPGSPYCATHGYEPPEITPAIDAALKALGNWGAA